MWNFTFESEGLYHIENSAYLEHIDADASTEEFGQPVGTVKVEPFRCESVPSCVKCFYFKQCIWCAANSTCFSRDASRNLPIGARHLLREA